MSDTIKIRKRKKKSATDRVKDSAKNIFSSISGSIHRKEDAIFDQEPSTVENPKDNDKNLIGSKITVEDPKPEVESNNDEDDNFLGNFKNKKKLKFLM